MENDLIYITLAGVLDALPNGFPRTETGVEIRLLKKVFSPNDAELFCELKLVKETAAEAAARTGRDAATLSARLEEMWWKGLIDCDTTGDERRYGLAPWIVGIYEFQLKYMDEEFARLHVEYMKTAGLFFMKERPQVMQVVPIEEKITGKSEAMPYELVSALIEKSQSFAVNECICKKQMRLLGRQCKKPREVCLVIAEKPHYYDNHPMGGRVITREEAGAILKKAEVAGLVHMTANLQNGHWFICNCCGCCCSQLLAARFGVKGAVNAHYYASIDPTKCANCGTCSDTRCPIKAIDAADDRHAVNRDKCIGCGLCASACPSGAITLTRKNADAIVQPPRDKREWYHLKARAEKKDISRFE